MPVTKHDRPVYNLTCDGCDYVADEDGDGVMRFESIEGARQWAYAEGWSDSGRWPNPEMHCPACVAKSEPDEPPTTFPAA